MKPDEVKLRLSDAFENPCAAGEFEWTATVKNINYGHNRELMENCRTLKEYAQFVDKVRRYRKEMGDIRAAIERTIQECIEEGILAEFLTVHRAEVFDVCLTEYDEETVMNALKEDSREEGLKEGFKKGRIEGMKDIVAIYNWLKKAGRAEEAEAIMQPENDSLRSRIQREYESVDNL